MSGRDDELRIRPGKIGDRARGGPAKSFVGEVLRAATAAGHNDHRPKGSGSGGGSRFGRGRFAAVVQGLSRRQRRVVVKARVVRHRGQRSRAAPLARHVAYLMRDGVSAEGRAAAMFDREADVADTRGFPARCEADRHHFRFIVAPEDAAELQDLRAFTRDLMGRAERDLGSRLDWIAVAHHNTANPHIHLLLRGRTDEGHDLVIARAYIARGLRARSEELVGLELGPRSDRAIAAALATEVRAERWTGLDRTLRALEHGAGDGVLDLRPGAPEPRDADLRGLLLGRARTLQRLGLAEPLAPAVWALKPDAEATLRALGERGDIIRTMHRAMADRAPRPLAEFAIEDAASGPVLGRLAARGLHDALGGEAYRAEELAERAADRAARGQPAERLGQVSFADLYIHPLNPRLDPPQAEIDALAKNIRELGLIQNLAGLRSKDGKVGVIAGGRRLRALAQLQDDERLPPCRSSSLTTRRPQRCGRLPRTASGQHCILPTKSTSTPCSARRAAHHCACHGLASRLLKKCRGRL